MQVPFDKFRQLPKLEKKNFTTNSNWTKSKKTQDKIKFFKPFTYIFGKVTCPSNKNLNIPLTTARHVSP